MAEIRDADCKTALAILKVEVDEIKKDIGSLCTSCDRCLIRKAVIGLIAVMGASVIGALMILILRSPK